jgi:hypothetical protein
VEGRALEGMDVPLPLLWHAAELCISCIPFSFVVVGVVLGLEDDCPPSRKDTAVEVEFIGFEEEAAEDW